MKEHKKLSYKDLKAGVNKESLNFKNTNELESIHGIVGQERAEEAFEFGINMRMSGYNIYMSGPTGVGKTSYALNYLNEMAKDEKVPEDWCYVNDFERTSHAVAINFEAGKGKEFAKDIENMIENITIEIPKFFSTESYDGEKIKIVRNYQLLKDDIMRELKEKAKKMDFAVKNTDTTIYFMPIVKGETLDEEAYAKLKKKEKEEINKKSLEIQVDAEEIIKKIKDADKDLKKELDKLENLTGLKAVETYINEMKEKYGDKPKVVEYLKFMQEDILKNITEFLDAEDREDDMEGAFPWPVKVNVEEITTNYKVNLFVDNSKTEGAPVIIESNPTYYKMIGKVEYENELGNLTTDFRKIKSGLLHRANGGYLVLKIEDLLKNPLSWDALKRSLKINEIHIESLRDQYAVVSVASLKPEEIPLDVKIVLIGNSYYYHMLYEYDEDFKKLFKLRVDFSAQMEKNVENELKIAKFVKSFTEKEGALPFDSAAVSRVIEYSTRMAGNQNKLSTKLNSLVEILSESYVWAKLDKKKIVTDRHIEKALKEREKRSSLYEEQLEELIEDEIIMIDTKGSETGQINGLAVLDTGAYAFGKPQRITATTYRGKSGIINIEKEADLSGKIHNKGINILVGYLGQTYAQNFPLSLSCRVAFEQSYGGVDGDSASSTELYAILSSLSECPIKQSIAVTGSINQKGEIQPIGGVNEKIEGFFKLCKKRKLNGEHGVIIPIQNVKDLVLSDEVIKAVKEDKFSIYPVKNIDEGIEILTGVKAGRKNKNGTFSKDSIHEKVYNKLKLFNDIK